MVVLKRVMFFVFSFGVSLATLGAHLATPGSWFDRWYLGKYMTYGLPSPFGTHWGPVSYILWICLALALVMTWLLLSGPTLLRRMFTAGPRIGPLTSGVPLAIPRGRRRRVRP